ncbi:hypothetical protein WJX73_002724 [Symbiochloris irregularis]|uniref:Dynein heavy chain n=1 Tax=Symbiochloris irregularis TaxID=706552 RepID=A0AAW1Q362_9CHLO
MKPSSLTRSAPRAAAKKTKEVPAAVKERLEPLLRLAAADGEDIWAVPDNKQAFLDFCFNPKALKLLAYQTGRDPKHICLTDGHPELDSGKAVYLLKLEAAALTPENVEGVVQCGELNMASPTESLLATIQGVFGPCLTAHNEWSDTVKREFGGRLHKVMTELTDAVQGAKGKTVLYAPQEGLDDVQEIARDQERVKQLETRIIHWTRQVRVVARAPEGGPGRASPLDELAFWRARLADLTGIREQLQLPGVQKVEVVLESTYSPYLAPWRTLKQDIDQGIALAADNVKYLAILEAPCTALSKAAPKDVMGKLPPVVHCLRALWVLCPHYRAPDHMVELLRQLGGQVIACCSAAINFQALLAGDVTACVARLEESVEALEAWKALYQQTRDKIATGRSSALWNFDETDVFAQTNAFIHRCRDLLALAGAQCQHAPRAALPVFGGASGLTITQGIKGIQDNFQALVEPLRNLNYTALDVSATAWFDDFQRFTFGVKDLDLLLCNVIEGAYENTAGVLAQLELTEAFHSMAATPTIQQCTARKAGDMYALWLRDLDAVRQQFDSLRRNPPTSAAFPTFGMRAAAADALLQRLQGAFTLHAALRDVLPQIPAADEAIAMHQQVVGAIEQYLTVTHNEWWQGTEALAGNLSCGLVAQHPSAKGLLTHGLGNLVGDVLLEVPVWARLARPVPTPVQDLAEQAEKLRTTAASVTAIVRTYNKALGSLSREERRLFRERIRLVDRRVMPGISKLLWSRPKAPLDTYCREALWYGKELSHKVREYKMWQQRFDEVIKDIQEASFFVVDRKQVYDLKGFAAAQSQQHDRVRALLQDRHEIMSEGLDCLHAFFAQDGPEVLAEWDRYLHQLDWRVEDALRVAVKRAMAELSLALTGAPKAEPVPLFSTELKLDAGGHVELAPTIQDLFNMVHSVSRQLVSITDCIPRLVLTQPGYGPKSENSGTGTEAEPASQAEAPPMPSYYQVIGAEEDTTLKYVMQITNSISGIIERAQVLLVYWEKKYKPLWDQDRQAQLWRYEKANKPASTFRQDIEKYNRLAEEILAESAFENVRFLSIDAHPLQKALVAHCRAWTSQLLGLLHSTGQRELTALHKHMASQTEAMHSSITDMHTLADALALQQRLAADSEAFQGRFGPLEATYGTLAHFEVVTGDEEMENLEDMRPSLADFQQAFSEFEEVVSQRKSEQLQLLQGGCASFGEASQASLQAFRDSAPYSQKNWKPAEALDVLREARSKVAADHAALDELNFGVQLLQSEAVPIADMLTHEKEIMQLENTWSAVAQWDEGFGRVQNTTLADLKPAALEGLCSRLATLLDMEGVQQWPVWQDTDVKLRAFRAMLPMITVLQSPNLRPRHWQALEARTGRCYDPSKGSLTVQDMLDMNLAQHAGYITGHQRVVQLLDHQTIQLSRVRLSPHEPIFREDIKSQDEALRTITRLLEVILQVQHHWGMLNDLFGNAAHGGSAVDRQRAAHQAATEQLSSCMASVKAAAGIEQAAEKSVIESFERLLASLEQSKQSLGEFLADKCRSFPRLHYLASQDALHMLSCAEREATTIQPHIPKLFTGAHRLDIQPAPGGGHGMVVAGMLSGKGENLPFFQAVPVHGPLELWMSKVEAEMYLAVRNRAKQVQTDRKRAKVDEWVLAHQMQFLLLACQIGWTQACEEALRHAGSPTAALGQLHGTTGQFVQNLQQLMAGELSALNRSKLAALLVTTLHGQEVVARLRATKSRGMRDVMWGSQLRYYAPRSSDLVNVKQGIATFVYGSEYMGDVHRLVITPAVERDMQALTHATFMHSVGCTTGAISSGKTAVIQDLATLLARHVVMLHCHEDINPQRTGTALLGAAQTGAWILFDNLNCLRADALSAFAVQTGALLKAIKAKEDSLTFEGATIVLSPLAGVFASMSPCAASMGQLPESLQQLLLPVAMSPDLGIVAEVALTCRGFRSAKVLAKQLMTVRHLSQNLLLPQPQYLFDLRSFLLPAIQAAGDLRRQNASLPERDAVMQGITSCCTHMLEPSHASLFQTLLQESFSAVMPTKEAPEESKAGAEAAKAAAGSEGADAKQQQAGRPTSSPSKKMADEIKALRQASKKHVAGAQATVTLKQQAARDMQKVRAAVEEEMRSRHLPVVPAQLDRIEHIWRVKSAGQCNLLVGPACTGKSTAWQCLQGALHRLHVAQPDHSGYTKVQEHVIHTAALSFEQLYGSVSAATGQWQDGVLPAALRKANEDELNREQWIILQGPLNAAWPKLITTLVDKHVRTLPLPSGQSLRIADKVSIFIETDDLSKAAPNLISRTSLTQFSQADLGWQLLWQSWLSARKDAHPASAWLAAHGSRQLECAMAATEACHRKGHLQFASGSLVAVQNALRLLEATDVWSSLPGSAKLYQMWFSFALIWGIGGLIEASGRSMFEEAIRTGLPDLPTNLSVFDYKADLKAGTWVKWASLTPAFRAPEDASGSASIPRRAATAAAFLAYTFLQQGMHAVIVGPPGSGKSTLAAQVLAGLPASIASQSLCCNAQTTADELSHHVEMHLQQQSGGVWGPPSGKRQCVSCIDDLHLPKQASAGLNSAGDLLTGFINTSSWMGSSAAEVHQLKDVQLLGCMSMQPGQASSDSMRLLAKGLQHLEQHEFEPDKQVVLRLWCNEKAAYSAVTSIEEAQAIVDVKLSSSAASASLSEFQSTQTYTGQPASALFREDWIHVCHIHNVLQQRQRHALLLSRRGSNAPALAMLAATLADASVLTIDQKMEPASYRSRLLAALQEALSGGKRDVLLFTDADAGQLNDASHLMTSGSPPAWATPQDVQGLLEAAKPACKAAGLSGNAYDELLFLGKAVRDSICVVLCLDEAQGQYSDYSQSHSGCLEHMLVDTINEHAPNSLTDFATRELAGQCSSYEDKSNNISQAMAALHCSALARTAGSAALSVPLGSGHFRGLIFAFKRILYARQRRDVRELEKLVAEAQAGHDAKSAQAAQLQRHVVEGRAAAAAAVAQAQAQLQKMSADQLAELQGVNAPSVQLEATVSGVMMLLALPTGWKEAQAELGTQDLLSRLLALDTARVDDVTTRKLGRTMDAAKLSTEAVQGLPAAARPLVGWLQAYRAFGVAAQSLKAEQAQAEALLEAAEQLKASASNHQQQLSAAQQQMSSVEGAMEAASKDKQQLQAELQRMQSKLDKCKAEQPLLQATASAWQRDLDTVNARLTALPADAVLASAALTYGGAFPGQQRPHLQALWTQQVEKAGLTPSADFSLTSLVASQVQTCSWKRPGLASDAGALDAAALLLCSPCWPLVIDTEELAAAWIGKTVAADSKHYLDSKRSPKMHTVSAKSTGCCEELAGHVQTGSRVLLKDVGTHIDDRLASLLRKDFVSSEGKTWVQVGDQRLTVHPSFQLSILADSGMGQVPDCLQGRVSVLVHNADSDVEAQLRVAMLEYEQRTSTQTQEATTDRICKLLHSLDKQNETAVTAMQLCSGCILDSADVMAKLRELNKASTDADLTLQKLNADLKAAQDLPPRQAACVSHAAMLHAALNQVQSLNSLDFGRQPVDHVGPLQQSLAVARSAQVAQRKEDDAWVMARVTEQHTLLVLKQVCRSLHLQNRLLVALHSAMRCAELRGQLPAEQWAAFVRQDSGQASDAARADRPQWLPAPAWQGLRQLQALPSCQEVATALMAQPEGWQAWYASADAELAPLPHRLAAELAPFMELLFARCLRPDRLQQATLAFIGKNQGPAAELAIAQAVQQGQWVHLTNVDLAPEWLQQLPSMLQRVLSDQKAQAGFQLWLSASNTDALPAALVESCLVVAVEALQGTKAIMESLLAEAKVSKEPLPTRHALVYPRVCFALAFLHSTLVIQHQRGALRTVVRASDFMALDAMVRLCLEAARGSSVPWLQLQMLASEVVYGSRLSSTAEARQLEVAVQKLLHEGMMTHPDRTLVPGLPEAYGVPQEKTLADLQFQLDALPSPDPPSVYDWYLAGAVPTQLSANSGVLAKLRTLHASHWSDAAPDTLTLGAKDLEQARAAASDILVQIAAVESASDVALKLASGQVPDSWGINTHASATKLSDWLRALLDHVQTLAQMAGQPTSPAINLSAFIRPAALLTAVLQAGASKLSEPSGNMQFAASPASTDTSCRPSDGLIVKGLHLLGLDWDQQNGVMFPVQPELEGSSSLQGAILHL